MDRPKRSGVKHCWRRTFLGLFTVTLGLFPGCGGPLLDEVSLLPQVAQARTESLVTGEGSLGSCTFRPFLGPGFAPDRNAEWVAPLPGVTQAGLGLYLHDPLPLKVELEGRLQGSGPPRTVGFQLNGRSLASGAVQDGVGRFSLDIPAEALQPGMNWLTITGCAGTEWLSLKATPLGKGEVAVEPEREALTLPFHRRLEVSLSPEEERQVRLAVEPWTEPGSPALEEGSWKLEIGLATDEKPYLSLAQVVGEGETLALLRSDTGPRALALKAVYTGKGEPLPGQLGLRLLRPRLAREPLPQQVVTPTPVPPSTLPQGPRPNVLIYLVDTLRADRLSVYGGPSGISPALQAMAQDGVVYEGALSTAPWTKPSVASLMTGMDPVAHGVRDFTEKLPADRISLAEVFQGAGYQTAAFVTNPLVGRQFGFDQGFETFEDLPHSLTAQGVNARALPWLDQRKDGQPFFLYLHTLDPHIPYNPPPAFRKAWMRSWQVPPSGERSKAVLGSSRRPDFGRLVQALKRRSFEVDPPAIPQATYDNIEALYRAELANNDAAFGELLAHLKAKGLYDNTLIVFVSDHGEELLDREKLGHLYKVFQELVRIPLVVKLPGQESAGARVVAPCQVTDLMPTLLSRAGLPVPVEVSGRQLPLGVGGQGERVFFTDIEAGRQAVMAGQPEGNYLIDAVGVREGRWSAALCRAAQYPTDPFALYDLVEDPGEKVNLWEARRATALRLETLSRAYRARRGQEGPSAPTVPPEEADRMLRSLQYLR